MSYYNSSPKQGHDNSYTPQTTYTSAPVVSRATRPTNSFIAANPTYISSPFDDEPASSPSNTNNYEKNAHSPYDSYNQGSLSPSLTEKGLVGGAAANAGEQTYAMQHLGNNQNSPYDSYNNDINPYNHNSHYQNDNSQYYNGYEEDRPSLSNDTAPMRPHSDMETSDGLTRSKSGVTRVKYAKEKSKYLPCFPCIRSTCGRVTCCICLLLLLIIIALAIVIVTMFKMPTVNYLGTQGDPQFAFNQGNTTLAITLVANIEVNNPNPIGFNFESIVATAYYPNYTPSIGGGNLTNVDFPKKSNTTIHFPIAASYSGSENPGYTVIKDIFTKCGLTGSTATDLTINYDLTLSIKIIGIKISPTIKNQHVSLPCPANITDIANNIPGGLTSLLGSSST
ncbi:hypothetical protein EDD21DRAFT_366751 [Dissophora ornata]|nr:hypothetical protein BGZ58_009414 [Dissophora ornata]KAI8604270.1 hypothetical protein EDD21DRAFT_366751 [Dissophora ornata]